jgi:hypothetical protein
LLLGGRLSGFMGTPANGGLPDRSVQARRGLLGGPDHLEPTQFSFSRRVTEHSLEITKGLGRSHADRGLKFGDCKGVIFAPSCSLNTFYEAFMTALIAFA